MCYSPCVLHNVWNENTAVKRDAQYIVTCDREYYEKDMIKKKRGSFQLRERQLECHVILLPMFLLKVVSLGRDDGDVSMFQHADCSYSTSHRGEFHSH